MFGRTWTWEPRRQPRSFCPPSHDASYGQSRFACWITGQQNSPHSIAPIYRAIEHTRRVCIARISSRHTHRTASTQHTAGWGRTRTGARHHTQAQTYRLIRQLLQPQQRAPQDTRLVWCKVWYSILLFLVSSPELGKYSYYDSLAMICITANS